jgi:hypothetical protein
MLRLNGQRVSNKVKQKSFPEAVKEAPSGAFHAV